MGGLLSVIPDGIAETRPWKGSVPQGEKKIAHRFNGGYETEEIIQSPVRGERKWTRAAREN
jgi:hypothetical protein